MRPLRVPATLGNQIRLRRKGLCLKFQAAGAEILETKPLPR